MICTLHISNYALIDSLDIEFGAGLNIITGETGAGKSIILGALSLLLGGRADMRVVRDESRKSVIEAEFDVEGNHALDELLAANDIDNLSPKCILRRELAPGGRSRAFINDTPVNLTQLRAAAILLVDIHSQHQNLLLADPAFQLSIIDTLAGNSHLLAEYRRVYDDYRAILRQYTSLRDSLARSIADREYIEYQLQQLEELDLQPDEQASLEQERELLQNSQRICTHIDSALALLAFSQQNAADSLAQAATDCRALSGLVPDADSLAERLEAARVEAVDVADSLTALSRSLDNDPARIDAIDERLSTIYTLQTRHQADGIEGLLAVRDSLRARIDDIEHGDERLATLEEQAKNAKRRAMQIAKQLTDARQACAETFAAELRQGALPLGMANLRCEVQLTRTKLGPDGADRIDFMFAFNKNQPLRPVGETASGGEISRIMLTVKAIVARKMQLPTIIFDEVDTGVSGDVAARMGAMMADIASNIQVISITHLPQVAARAERHFKVYKEDDDVATNTRIRRLDADEHAAEIALMLSGSATDEQALATARTMITKFQESLNDSI